MKAENISTKVLFDPITLSLTVETQEEYNALRDSCLFLNRTDINPEKFSRKSRNALVEILETIGNELINGFQPK